MMGRLLADDAADSQDIFAHNSLTESAPRKRNLTGKNKLPLELRFKRRLHP